MEGTGLVLRPGTDAGVGILLDFLVQDKEFVRVQEIGLDHLNLVIVNIMVFLNTNSVHYNHLETILVSLFRNMVQI